MAKHLIFAAAFCLAVASSFGWEIRTAPNAPSYEQTAARELKDYLDKLVLPDGEITVEGKPVETFYVGNCEFARANGVAADELPEESWTVRSADGNVILAGGSPRGTLYAVYHLLEDVCNIHWLAPDKVPLCLPARKIAPNWKTRLIRSIQNPLQPLGFRCSWPR